MTPRPLEADALADFKWATSSAPLDDADAFIAADGGQRRQNRVSPFDHIDVGGLTARRSFESGHLRLERRIGTSPSFRTSAGGPCRSLEERFACFRRIRIRDPMAKWTALPILFSGAFPVISWLPKGNGGRKLAEGSFFFEEFPIVRRKETNKMDRPNTGLRNLKSRSRITSGNLGSRTAGDWCASGSNAQQRTSAKIGNSLRTEKKSRRSPRLKTLIFSDRRESKAARLRGERGGHCAETLY